MRTLILPYFLISLNVFGQSQRMVDPQTRLLEKITLNYDSVISYSSDCGTALRLIILGLKNDSWERTEFVATLDKNDYKIANQTKISPTPVNMNQIKLLTDYLYHNQFWAINLDSLNKDGEGGVWTPIADGCSQRISTRFKTKEQCLTSYNADQYQQMYFTVDRERFINCRDYFLKTFGE